MQRLWSWQKEQHQKEGAPEHPKILKEKVLIIALGAITPELEEWLRQIAGTVSEVSDQSCAVLYELLRCCADTSFALWLAFSPVPTHWLSLGKMAERWGHAKINPQTHRDLSTNSPFPLESPQVHHLKWLWPLNAWQEEGNNCNPSVGQQIAED